jgi:ABC-type polysaccharide/polyol phosphate export permease
VGNSTLHLQLAEGADQDLARQAIWRVVGREPVLTPESGRMNVPLETADGAGDVLIGLRQAGVTVVSVSVSKPTLDEVFLARLAPLAGPMIADLVRYLIAATLTFVMGVVIGYRPGGGALGVLGAIVLAIFTGWAIAWIFTFIGTIARSARSVQGLSMLILFPLTFLSNAFVPVRTLPGPLAAFVKVNPVSHLVSATRDLANHAVISGEVGWTLLAGLAVIVVFAPLSVHSYKRHI